MLDTVVISGLVTVAVIVLMMVYAGVYTCRHMKHDQEKARRGK